MNKLAKYRNEIGLVIAILVVVGITGLASDAYRQKPIPNATEILRQASMLGIFALGAALVIISGGIDLSAGSVIAFSGSVCAAILLALAPHNDAGDPVTKNLEWWMYAVAFLGTLAAGFLIGTFHAWLITVVGLPPFVATLASLVGLRSLALVSVQDLTSVLTTTGRTSQIYINDRNFRVLANDWRIPLTIFLVLAFLTWLLMSRTVIGRHLYAMGGNEAAARLSGIRTDRLKWLAYCLGAMTASIAGILFCAEIGTANPTTQGQGYELNAIAAAVVGGCSLQGGIGSVPGVMLGVLFLRVVIDAVAKIVKSGADDFQGIIVGLLVVLAVAFNELRQAGRGQRKKFFTGHLGTITIGILSVLAALMTRLMVGRQYGLPVLVVALIVLTTLKLLERRGAARQTLISE